jgi:hypothetical protein
MNNNKSVLVRIEQALDRMERRLKMIDTRVGHLHAAANFSLNKYNTSTRPKKNTGGSYFASSRPTLFGKAQTSPGPVRRKTNSNFAKLKF